VLYLAEVKKKTGLMGSRAELKLWACQRSEQSWVGVPGEEMIAMPPEQAGNYNDGALVLVDINASTKQIQRFLEAGRQLVTILQNFSRFQEKFKSQEDEIEQWKASLTYQSQELQRRELEMEARLEQMQDMEGEFARLEQRREEVQRLQSDFEKDRLNLESSWTQLQAEQQRLEELQVQLSQGRGLNVEQVDHLQGLINQALASVPSPSMLQQQFQGVATALGTQQELLSHHWQQLEQVKSSAHQQHVNVDQQTQDLQQRSLTCQELQKNLAASRTELQVQQQAYQLTQDMYDRLTSVSQAQELVYQQLCLATGQAVSSAGLNTKVDLEALEQMSLEQLQDIVQELKRELDKVSRFVNDQEEELNLQKQTVDELQAKMQQASDYDRLRLEAELSDEQDGYRLLDETLVGQRRNLREREQILGLHVMVLEKRQGAMVTSAQGDQVDLRPLVQQLTLERQQRKAELEQLEAKRQRISATIDQLQQTINQQSEAYESQQRELTQLEATLQAQRAEAVGLSVRLQIYQELLQSLQDPLTQARQSLEASLGGLDQNQGEQQAQVIAQVQQVLAQLSAGV
jgi:chromosome segregation ATPase